MSDEMTIQPALTPAQWAMDGTTEPVLLNGKDASRRVYFRQPAGRDEGFGVELNADNSMSVWDDSWGIGVESGIRHGVAALCLYGQPFGFNTIDVASLRWGIARLDKALRDEGREFPESVLELQQLKRLAARLAALLPPTPQ